MPGEMPPKSLSQRIRQVLLEGPATCREIQAALPDLSVRQVSIGLAVLLAMKHAISPETVPDPDPPEGRYRRNLKLYELTEAGARRTQELNEGR